MKQMFEFTREHCTLKMDSSLFIHVSDDPAQLSKAGKTMQSLGRILKGQMSRLTAEERDRAFEALKTLGVTSLDKAKEEYFIKDIFDVVESVITRLYPAVKKLSMGQRDKH